MSPQIHHALAHDLIRLPFSYVREGVTISDAQLPDNPIVYANNGFCTLTGYSIDEIIGKNCRYLQGADTDSAAVASISRAVRAGESVVVELLNYTKTGTPFWNRLSITPISDASGRVTHFIGIQDDVTSEHEKKALQASLSQRRAIATALLRGEQTERDRIGRELHDNISQALCTLKLYLEIAQQPEQGDSVLPEAHALVDNLIREVRQLSHQLIKSRIEDIDFENRLLEIITPFRKTVSAQVDFTYAMDTAVLLPEDKQLVIARVLQEHLHNIRKYAEATLVRIHLGGSARELSLWVEDDGKGFDTQQAFEGIGIRNMQARVLALNGRFNLQSAPGDGTRLDVWMGS